MAATLLEVRALGKRFGGLVALDGVGFSLESGSVTGVIGPNGAGKSTLIGLLGGALRPSAGEILFGGADVTLLAAPERARRGIGRTFQIPRPFLDMTVEENLEVAQAAARQRRRGADARARRTEILERAGLAAARAVPARQLPLLRRKRLEVARALALEPTLLLLDEVGAGLIEAEVTELIGLIRDVAASGVTVLVVEHVLRIVRECCSRLLVLDFGRRIAEGPPAEVLASDDVAAIYLGTAHARSSSVPDAPGTGGASARHADTALASLVDRAPEPSAAGVPLLHLENATAAYGQVSALRNVNLSVSAGEVIAVLGPNGAGKTSLANLLSGALPLQQGTYRVDGRDVRGVRPDQIAALGVAHCMEGRRIFADLSVEQNLRIAARRAVAQDVEQRMATVFSLFPVLAERRRDSATAMSGGQQQMLAIGRALMAKPRVLVFDEISLGLAPIVMDRLYEALAALRRAGLTMLIVEQDVERALELADRAYVLEHGEIALEGPASSVRADPRLRQLYIGGAD